MADRLLYDGTERELQSFPLESYLRELPAGRPDFRVPTGTNWTGYVAHWEIRPDDTLWLTHLQTQPADQGPEPGVRLVFPDTAGPVAAKWVSQRLRCVNAGDVRYDPRGGGAAYAGWLDLWVSDGRLVLAEEFRAPGDQRTAWRFTEHLEGIYGAEEGAFLRAIYADPADAAPRLVYADWLDERNDPRGEAIRLVERIRTMSPEAASRASVGRANLLARRLSQGLWCWVLGYDREAATVQAIATER
ncbi:MAG TPA: TIGR02996 domain-containing protein [Gemmataceae bacterium]|nr:TIGR02996 domain-containing protein [Gemmataceae bacterium]